MARFNLEDYETVESRLKKFYELYEDGRIVTEWENNMGYDSVSQPRIWVVKATAYLSAGDQANHLPKATGYAFEIEGTKGANETSALENAETSAIGRCLANLGLSGNKRASREEMQKVVRATDWLAEAAKLNDVESLRLLWAQANAASASEQVLNRIKELASGYSQSEHQGDSGSPAPSSTSKPTK